MYGKIYSVEEVQRKVEKPWQFTPSMLIAHALNLLQEENDANFQIAYLLLDVGVETIFKVFLTLPENSVKGRHADLGRANFPLLLKLVSEVANTQLEQTDLEQIKYYHRVRNKLYHQGDGVVPTRQNLEGYSKAAKKVLKTLLGVDLDGEIDNREVLPESIEAALEEALRPFRITEMQKMVKHIAEEIRIDTAVAVGRIRPQWVRRSFQRELMAIWERYPDREDDRHWERTGNQDKRREAFNLLLQQTIDDYEFIDHAVRDPTFLYLAALLRKMEWDVQEGLERYESLFSFIKKLSIWQDGSSVPSADMEALENEFREIKTWSETLQEMLERTFLQ